ncbi:MAG TPA: hypothetical protein VHX88_15250 [Solirubrobacteraceae bacterium]|jgi:oxaloacetate decarboxylase alpha subunit|nr:hypothetical protein [Solirubrobacteraceae bacterium]
MAEIQFCDQTFRDGPQSLWGMRMRAGMITDIAHHMDRAGFYSIDVPSGGFYTVMMRFLREDPIEAAQHYRRMMPNSTLRYGQRPSSSGQYGISSYAVLDFYTRYMADRMQMDSVWVFDCLYDMAEMEYRARRCHEAGMLVVPSIMYGISPVHTDEFYADRVREMVSWGVGSSIYFEDAPGILTPERAATLVPALVQACGDLPLEMHCHNTTGLAPLNYLTAIEHGAHILHTCSRPMANGPSLPSTEMMIVNIESAGHTHNLDTTGFDAVAEHLERIALQEGHPIGTCQEYDRRLYDHQLPGGMTGTFKAQLAQYGMPEKLEAVLEEIPYVRAAFGHPVSATPFSQLLGTQAVLNVVTGDRWSITTDEVAMYMIGAFGEPPAPIDENARDKLLSTPAGRKMVGWKRPETTLLQMRDQLGSGDDDDEFMRRYFAPVPDIEATRAAGPLPLRYQFADDVDRLMRAALDAGRARRVRLRTPSVSIELSKSPES